MIAMKWGRAKKRWIKIVDGDLTSMGVGDWKERSEFGRSIKLIIQKAFCAIIIIIILQNPKKQDDVKEN